MKLVLFLSLFIFGCASIPHEFKSAYPDSVLWSGAWKSEEYTLVYGDVSTMLPKKLAVNQKLEIPVSISFGNFSSYKPGKTYVAIYSGNINNNSAKGSYNPKRRLEPKILNLTFSNGRYQIAEKFTITFNKEMNEAKGYWKSSDGDKGIFTLHKGGV